ncbi:MAG: GAF domain-containing protein [Prevotella sp.]|nr:GAF domain-containing protein [Prevotella sp.]
MENKAQQYDTLCRQIAALVKGESDETGVMANVAAALKEAFPERFFWVGFYRITHSPSLLAREGEAVLRLGPFQGPVACYEISFGKGVCGTAWKERKTIVVPDVEQFPGHIACSSLSRSEIVVPVFDRQGEVQAVLDIDSRDLDAFDETDRLFLERIVKTMAGEIY